MTMVKSLVALATERMLLKTSGPTFLRGIEFMYAAGLAPDRLSVMMTQSSKFVLQFHSRCDVRPFAANYPNFARVLRGIVHVRAWRIKSIEFVNVAFDMRDVENLERAIDKLGVELVLLRNCTYPGVPRGDEAVKFLSALNRKKQAVVCEYGDDRLKHRIARRVPPHRVHRPSRLFAEIAQLNAAEREAENLRGLLAAPNVVVAVNEAAGAALQPPQLDPLPAPAPLPPILPPVAVHHQRQRQEEIFAFARRVHEQLPPEHALQRRAMFAHEEGGAVDLFNMYQRLDRMRQHEAIFGRGAIPPPMPVDDSTIRFLFQFVNEQERAAIFDRMRRQYNQNVAAVFLEAANAVPAMDLNMVGNPAAEQHQNQQQEDANDDEDEDDDDDIDEHNADDVAAARRHAAAIVERMEFDDDDNGGDVVDRSAGGVGGGVDGDVEVEVIIEGDAGVERQVQAAEDVPEEEAILIEDY